MEGELNFGTDSKFMISLAITLTANDTDVVVAESPHGTLSGTAPNLTYSPDAGYTGPDNFTLKTNKRSTISF
jgi:hypothetical protein